MAAEKSRMEILESENLKLYKKIEQMEQDLKLAAEIGNQLLVTNQDLTKQNEDSAKDFTNRIEALEQSRHSSQLKLDHAVQMSKDKDEELENVKAHLENLKSDFEMKEKTEHLSVVNQLKRQVEQLRSETDQSQLQISHLEEKLKNSEEDSESLRQELQAKVDALNETCSEEMAQLHSDVASLNMEKRELLSQLNDSRHEIEQIKLSLTTAQNQLTAREAEVEEQQCQATSYYNALENCREEVQELKVQLDIARMDSQDQKKKGNSLFAEVEDRRVEAEKLMITLKVQNETLNKQYKMEKETVHKLKLQMATLLQMSTGRADSRHLDRIHVQLDQARCEISNLTVKLEAAERSLESKGANISWLDLLKTHFNEDYAGFVSAIIKKKDEELESIKSELASRRLQLMAETQKGIEYQRQVYGLEQEVEEQIGVHMKLRVKIEEMETKYEPDKHRRTKKVVLKAEKIAMPEPKEAAVVEDKENEEQLVSTSPQVELVKVPTTIKVHKEDISTIEPNTTCEVKPALINKDALQALLPSLPKKSATTHGQAAKKVVSISDDVNILEISNPDDSDVQEGNSANPQAGKGRIKGGKFVTGRTIQVKAAQPAGEDEENCKVQ